MADESVSIVIYIDAALVSIHFTQPTKIPATVNPFEFHANASTIKFHSKYHNISRMKKLNINITIFPCLVYPSRSKSILSAAINIIA
jgi:hypothetical protein